MFITGASRGIGKAIALRAARDGANVAIAAKTAEPHPKLPGTVYTAAKECTYKLTPSHPHMYTSDTSNSAVLSFKLTTVKQAPLTAILSPN